MSRFSVWRSFCAKLSESNVRIKMMASKEILKNPSEITAELVKISENNLVGLTNGVNKGTSFEIKKEHVVNHVGHQQNDSVNSQTVKKILSENSDEQAKILNENKIFVESSKGKFLALVFFGRDFFSRVTFFLDDPNRSHKKKKKDRDRDRDGKILEINSYLKTNLCDLPGKKEKPAENREKSKKSKKDKKDREKKHKDEKRKEAIKDQQPVVSSTTQTLPQVAFPPQQQVVLISTSKEEVITSTKIEVISSPKIEEISVAEAAPPEIFSPKEEVVSTVKEDIIVVPEEKKPEIPIKEEIQEIIPMKEKEKPSIDEPSAKKIKIEVIRKTEKTREDVTRMLNFTGALEPPCPPCDLKSSVESLSLSSTTNSTPASSRKNSEDVKRTSDDTKKKLLSVPEKRGDSRTSSSDSHRSKNHKSSSSHHKSSHSHSSSSSSHKHSSSSSSSRDCSKCYKRSKIRRKSVGTQCQDHKLVTEPTKVPIINRNQNCQPGLEHLKYGRFFRVETHCNGGASVVHLYQDEIDSLNPEEMDEMVNEFFSLTFAEDENGYAQHVMGIVHDAAAYLPDMLEHLAENYSTLTVKAGVLGRNSDIETCTVSQYNEQVRRVLYFLSVTDFIVLGILVLFF